MDRSWDILVVRNLGIVVTHQVLMVHRYHNQDNMDLKMDLKFYLLDRLNLNSNVLKLFQHRLEKIHLSVPCGFQHQAAVNQKKSVKIKILWDYNFY